MAGIILSQAIYRELHVDISLEDLAMVARGRFQLPTFALGVRCSMQLSYRAIKPSVSRGLPGLG
jgi:hypothetical protein